MPNSEAHYTKHKHNTPHHKINQCPDITTYGIGKVASHPRKQTQSMYNHSAHDIKRCNTHCYQHNLQNPSKHNLSHHTTKIRKGTPYTQLWPTTHPQNLDASQHNTWHTRMTSCTQRPEHTFKSIPFTHNYKPWKVYHTKHIKRTHAINTRPQNTPKLTYKSEPLHHFTQPHLKQATTNPNANTHTHFLQKQRTPKHRTHTWLSNALPTPHSQTTSQHLPPHLTCKTAHSQK